MSSNPQKSRQPRPTSTCTTLNLWWARGFRSKDKNLSSRCEGVAVWLGKKEMRSKKVGDVYQLHVTVPAAAWVFSNSSQSSCNCSVPWGQCRPYAPQGQAHKPLCTPLLPLCPPLALWLPNHFSFLLTKPHSGEARLLLPTSAITAPPRTVMEGFSTQLFVLLSSQGPIQQPSLCVCVEGGSLGGGGGGCLVPGSLVKNLPGNAGDVGLIPGSGRSPGGGNGNPFQYSWLENSMDGGPWQAIAHGVTKGLAWLSRHTCLPPSFSSTCLSHLFTGLCSGLSSPFLAPILSHHCLSFWVTLFLF